MNNLTLEKNNKVLTKGTIKDVIYHLCNVESNIYFALAHKGYKIKNNGNIIDVSNEIKEKIEHQYNKELYEKRINKIHALIKSLNLDIEKTTNIEETTQYIDPDCISIHAVTKTSNFINFSMKYNNKNKITVTPSFQRDNQGNYINPYDYNENHLSISFSFDKKLELMKKDIEKRFIPTFKELEKRFFEQLNNSNSYHDNTLKNMKELKEQEITEDEIKTHALSIKNDNISSITVSGNSVTINLYSLAVEQAKKVIKALS